MVASVRALEKLGLIKTTEDTALLDRFIDKEDIADYALESIATLVKEGLVVGEGNKLNPRSSTTRVETAVFIYRLFNRLYDR